MVIKIVILSTAVLSVFTMLGWLPPDTFMRFWEAAFVMAVKAAVFTMIPCGFLLAIYLKLQG